MGRNMNRRNALSISFFVLTFASATAVADVSLRSLLDEISVRESLTRLPEPAYTAHLHSSHDRGTVARDRPGWFANEDHTNFIRKEQVDGRTEHVLLDVSGPGAITRFWCTVGETDGKGLLRIYLDGRKVVEGPVLELLGGGRLCGAPLSDGVAHETPFLMRGHNLYLPIPYAKSCKVTYESRDLHPPAGKGIRPEKFYYNIETREYAAGTEVETFSLSVLDRAKSIVEKTNAALLAPLESAIPANCHEESFDGMLNPGERRELAFDGEGAVRYIGWSVTRADADEAAANLRVEMAFDGVRTVDVPAGALFGTGCLFAPHATRFTAAAESGASCCAWVMPYARTCKFKVVNRGERAIRIERSRIAVSPYAWTAGRSMYFHASWRLWANMRVTPFYPLDANFASVSGTGLFAGVLVDVRNQGSGWWGEGDEKVFVDGAESPVMIGTGSEDHFGYAWGLATKFSHPFVAQPEGNGARAPGRVVNLRWRALDAIPFTSGIRYDMEVIPQRPDEVDYGMFACWYAVETSK